MRWGIFGCAAACALLQMGAAQAQDIVFNQYTIHRVSPAAKYFTPGSLIMGWYYKGVLRLEMVCRHRVDVDTSNDILKAKLEQSSGTSQSGWTFDIGAKAAEVLNAEFGGNLVKSVTMSASDVTVYEYSAEDLREIRNNLLARKSCAAEIANSRYRSRDNYNGGRAGIFQNMRYAIGNIVYTVDFNKDNPKALSANVQAQITKTFQTKFGLTYLNSSQSQLKGENVVLGLYPVWRPQW